jgi:phage/plasmid-associated DNA primase
MSDEEMDWASASASREHSPFDLSSLDEALREKPRKPKGDIRIELPKGFTKPKPKPTIAKCSATTLKNTQCSNNAKEECDGMCQRHFNMQEKKGESKTPEGDSGTSSRSEPPPTPTNKHNYVQKYNINDVKKAREELKHPEFESSELEDAFRSFVEMPSHARFGEFISQLYRHDYLRRIKIAGSKGPFWFFNKTTVLWVKTSDLADFHQIICSIIAPMIDERLGPLEEELEMVQGNKAAVAEVKSAIKELKSIYKITETESFFKSSMKYAIPDMSEPNFEFLLDSKDEFLSVKGGLVVNLRTGQVRERTPEDYFTWETPIGINYNAWPENKFTEFMHKFCCEDPIREDAWQRVLGNAITGDTTEQVFYPTMGDGSNGKSLLFAILTKVLGKEVVAHAMADTLCGKIGKGTMSALIKLVRSRVVCAESTKEHKISEQILKFLTGEEGGDLRDMYEKTGEKVARCHLVVFFNEPCEGYNPNSSTGNKRRPHRMEACASFAKDDKTFIERTKALEEGKAPYLKVYRSNKHFLKEMTQEDFEYALLWLIEGAKKWFAQGLSTAEPAETPANPLETFSSTREQPFLDFAKAQLEFKKGTKCLATTVQTKWNKYRMSKFVKMKQTDADGAMDAVMLKKNVYKSKDKKGVEYYYGVQLLNGSDNESESEED